MVSNKNDEKFVSEKAPSLFHYTTGAGLHGILKTNCLWATHYRHLNDLHEGVIGWKYLQEIIIKVMKKEFQKRCEPGFSLDVVNDIIADINHFEGGVLPAPETPYDYESFCRFEAWRNIRFREIAYNDSGLSGHYILSFCAHEINSKSYANGLLSQWRGYGINGGYAIRFNTEKVESIFGKHMDMAYGEMFDVIYHDDKPKYKELNLEAFIQNIVFYMDNHLTGVDYDFNPDEVEEIMVCIGRLKHAGFSEEKEYRIIAWMDNTRKASKNRKSKKHDFPICHRENNGRLIPYVELMKGHVKSAIEAIIVGPHPESERRAEALQEILKGSGIEVSISSLPYTA
jgi:hypothetical protein